MGGNIIDFYPTASVAMSWDVNWQQPKTIDCNGLIQGPDLKFNPAKLIQNGVSTNSAVVNVPGGLYYYLPAFAYCTSSRGPGDMPQTLVFNRNIYLDGSSNLQLTVPGYYQVTVVANSFNRNATFNVNISQVTNASLTALEGSTSSSQWFGQNSLTIIVKVDTPCGIVVNLANSSDDIHRACWTTVKWISQVSDATISETQPSTPLILPGPVTNSAVVNSPGGLYYYLPAFAYCTSTGGPNDMPQTLVYSNNITVDDSKNLKLTIPGYYEVTVVANSFNRNATFNIRITQWVNGTQVKSEGSTSSSQWFGQNSVTVIFKVDTPCGIVVNLSSSSADIHRACWTTVKWISQVSDATISETQPSTPLILPGPVTNSAVVNSVGGLYYYLPAFAYCTSTGPNDMPQTLVYGNNITVDDSKNLKLTVLGYYEVTVVANSFNRNATFNVRISQWVNGTQVKSEGSTSSSQWFGQNSLTIILKVDTPCGIVVNLANSSDDIHRACWTTVKWISM